MNTALVTTGILPLTIGSTETFEVQAALNGLPWDLTAGTASLILSDPTGAKTTISATISGSTARAPWTVVTPIGTWVRAWSVTDASGVKQVSRPIVFTVIDSPS